MANKYDTDLTGMSRADVVALRARLLLDDDFRKDLVNGKVEARLANQAIAEFLVNNGGGKLSNMELKNDGFGLTEPQS